MAAHLAPSLSVAYPDLELEPFDVAAIRRPRSISCSSGFLTKRRSHVVPELVDHVGCVVDLSAAFRLQRRQRPTRVGTASRTISPNCSAGPSTACRSERARKLPGARLVATPGCYVTAATLALAPLLDAGLDRARRDHRRRRQRRVRRRPDADPRARRSAPSTRTSPPTDCSTIGTPRRSSRT